MQKLAAVQTRLAGWSKQSLIGSVALVVVAGAAYCASLGTKVRFADEADYLRLSANLKRTGVYSLDAVHPSAYRPPGYPYLLAGLRELGASVQVLRGVNVVFLAIAVWAAWWLARRIGGPAAATLAAPAVALYPIGFYTMGAYYPQTMGMALLLVGLVALASIPGQTHPYWRVAGAGLAFGLLIVTIPTFLLALVLGVAWLGWKTRRVVAPVLVLAIAAVLPLAWTIRNAHEMHSFIPVSTNNGINLVLGNSEHAGPRTGVDANISRYLRVVQQRHLDEVQSDKYLRDSAVDWIKAHPARASVLFGEKTADYFAPYDRLGTDSQNSGAQQALAVVSYLPLLALLVLRLVRWRRDRPDDLEKLLLIIYLVSAPAQAVFFTRVRFRSPLDPLLIVIAAGLIARWPGRGQRTEDDPVSVDQAPTSMVSRSGTAGEGPT
jgi:hypothetical protein